MCCFFLLDCTRRAGGKILVHCEAGISRSPTICMAYLMKMRKFRLEEAFDYIKQRRSLISPNFGFMGQLLQYESEILSSAPSPPVASCKRDAVSFFKEELTLSKSFEGSCYTFPTSVLNSMPIHSPVHPLKLNPISASSSCWTLLGARDNTISWAPETKQVTVQPNISSTCNIEDLTNFNHTKAIYTRKGLCADSFEFKAWASYAVSNPYLVLSPASSCFSLK